MAIPEYVPAKVVGPAAAPTTFAETLTPTRPPVLPVASLQTVPSKDAKVPETAASKVIVPGAPPERVPANRPESSALNVPSE